MEIFYIEIIVLIFIGIIEFNPKRIYNAEKQKKDDNISRIILPFLYVIFILYYFIIHIFNIPLLRSDLLFELFGIIFLIIGLGIRIIAMKDLKDNFSYSLISPKKICKNGIYKYIRHPAYLGSIFYALGMLFITFSIISFIFVFVIIGFIFYRIRLEDALLFKYFGKNFEEYKKKTPGFFPLHLFLK